MRLVSARLSGSGSYRYHLDQRAAPSTPSTPLISTSHHASSAVARATNVAEADDQARRRRSPRTHGCCIGNTIESARSASLAPHAQAPAFLQRRFTVVSPDGVSRRILS